MPNIVFMPFNISKKIVLVICSISLISALLLGWKVEFKLQDLEKLAQFVASIVVVIGTIGITIFAIPLDENMMNSKENKKEIILRYIGTMGVAISAAFFAYILSIVGGVLSQFTIKIFCLLMLMYLVNMITSTFASIVAYFNIRD